MEKIRRIPFAIVLSGLVASTSHSCAGSIGDILELGAQFYRLRGHPGVKRGQEEEQLPEGCRKVFIIPQANNSIGHSEILCDDTKQEEENR